MAIADRSNLPLTRESYLRLERELEELQLELRQPGDPQADAIAEARIARLEGILTQAEIVEESAGGDTVQIGSAVSVRDEDSRRTATYLVDGAHGSMEPNVITAISPMGSALIGSAPGELVEVALPSGRTRRFTVLQVAHGAAP